MRTEQLLEEARRTGYLVARSNAAERTARRQWWYECERMNLPYVVVTPRKTWASVDLDMSPAGRELSEEDGERVRAAILARYTHRGWFVSGCRTAGIPSLRIDTAVSLAAELVAIATGKAEEA
jgi:hypothetical protein